MKVRVVCGAPASGKTTYVRENAGDNSLIYDFDQIMRAFTNNKLYRNNDNLIMGNKNAS